MKSSSCFVVILVILLSGTIGVCMSSIEMKTDTLLLKNIEALTEDETSHYWCLGNEDECVVGPGFVIVGKLTEAPTP